MNQSEDQSASVGALANVGVALADRESVESAARIVDQAFRSERFRRRAYWVALAVFFAVGLQLVTADGIDLESLWLLGGVAAGHLVVHFWWGVRNRARLAARARDEVLDERALVEALGVAQRGRPAKDAVRSVSERRSLRAR